MYPEKGGRSIVFTHLYEPRLSTVPMWGGGGVPGNVYFRGNMSPFRGLFIPKSFTQGLRPLGKLRQALGSHSCAASRLECDEASKSLAQRGIHSPRYFFLHCICKH